MYIDCNGDKDDNDGGDDYIHDDDDGDDDNGSWWLSLWLLQAPGESSGAGREHQWSSVGHNLGDMHLDGHDRCYFNASVRRSMNKVRGELPTFIAFTG